MLVLPRWRVGLVSGRQLLRTPTGLLRLGEVRQALAPQRLAQLQQPARLDLADALAGDAVGPRHLLQRARVAVLQPEAQLDDLPLPRRQRPQDLGDALA